jgi:hypothetical protein
MPSGTRLYPVDSLRLADTRAVRKINLRVW